MSAAFHTLPDASARGSAGPRGDPSGSPAGRTKRHSAVDTGIPTEIGTYQAMAVAKSDAGTATRFFASAVVPGMA